jgi:hypothetical protein
MNLSNILLAGIQGVYTLYSWFSNSFKVPSGWKNEKVLLNFDAVDYEATVLSMARRLVSTGEDTSASLLT